MNAPKPTHTPGPWTVQEQLDRKGGIISIDIHQVAEDSCRSTCSIKWASGIDAEDRANARLIAAAPDLLAAAKWARRAFGELRGGPHEEPKILELLCAAIARAEGR